MPGTSLVAPGDSITSGDRTSTVRKTGTRPSTRAPLVAALLVVSLMGAACSGGSSRHEVATPFGYKLDCPSESVISGEGQVMPDTEGSETAQQAVDVFQGAARPPGEPSIEAQTANKVVFVFKDADGNRLGHLFVARTGSGWFVLQMERCDEES